MTRKANARLAGFMFLFYIVVGLPGWLLFDGLVNADGMAGKLVGIAQNVPRAHLAVVLILLTIFVAWTLAVSLYAITRDEDADLALLALSCRFGEGVIAVINLFAMLGLLSIARSAAATAPDAAGAEALGALLLRARGWSYIVGATVFAVGSTIFAYLFLRARSIPVSLAWLGVFASVLLVVGLPLQLVGLVRESVATYLWGPMAVYEVTLAFWLLIKGVAEPRPRPSPA